MAGQGTEVVELTPQQILLVIIDRFWCTRDGEELGMVEADTELCSIIDTILGEAMRQTSTTSIEELTEFMLRHFGDKEIRIRVKPTSEHMKRYLETLT